MAQFIYKGTNLIQKHTGKTTCEGCFFNPPVRDDETNIFLCCETVNDKFLFPCSKDIIYVKEEDNRNI
jgi:hypothetical protein